MLQNLRCDICPYNDRAQAVFGEGSRRKEERKEVVDPSGIKLVWKETKWDNSGSYDVVVVGISPGKEEMYQGRPFVGASGQVLRRTLEQLGILEYYLTNVFLCEAEVSSVSKAIEVAEQTGELERLLNEIRARNPRLIIALGDVPLHALVEGQLSEYTVKELEGRVVPGKVGPTLAIAHPAYYLRRDPIEFLDFVECMRAGVRYLSGVYTQAYEPSMVEVTFDNYTDVLNELDKYTEIAVDLETTGYYAYGWNPDKVLEMGLAVSPDKAYIVPAELIPEFKKLLEEKDGIYWNAQFDCAFLKHFGINAKASFDGMLAHYTLDERPHSHGLKRVAQIYLGCEDWERDIDKYFVKGTRKSASYEVIPRDIRHIYLAKDVTRTLHLKQVLEHDVNKKVFYEILMPACRMFIEIEERGIRINPEKLLKMQPVLERELEALEQELVSLAGEWFNPASPSQTLNILQKLGIPANSTRKEHLQEFIGEPIVDKLLEYRDIAKTKGTYIEGFARFVDRNFRIHPRVDLAGTVTGRLASRDPSIMNIKEDSKLKEIFLPEVGQVLAYGDLKGNELRWYCIVSGDEELASLLRRGADPHVTVANLAYGEQNVKNNPRLKWLAKRVVFGRLYGRGMDSIKEQVGGSFDDVVAAIDKLFPNIRNYHSQIREELKKGYLTSYFGRVRRFPLVTRDNFHKVLREAINFPIQSAGSDLMLLCMLHLWEIKDDWGIWPFWPIHDSITSNVPDPSYVPRLKKELEEYATSLVNGKIPFIWAFDWGYDWSLQKERQY